MSSFPNSPQLLKGGLVLIRPDNSKVERVIALQYNADSLSRTLQVQAIGADGGGGRSEALRFKAPAVETLKIEAEIDATDQLEVGDSTAASVGVAAQLAVLELLVHPSTAQLEKANQEANSGTLEIAAMEALLTLFVWSKNRVLPVRLTEFSVTEEAFDAVLNPIRAKVSLGMRVLTVDDVGFSHKAGGLFMSYLRQKETLANLSPKAQLRALGLNNIP